jgi:hypothetical protein
MSLAHPGIVEAGMRLREANREAWDALVVSLTEFASRRRDQMLACRGDELILAQGQAQALAALAEIFSNVVEHAERQQVAREEMRRKQQAMR